MAKRKLDRQRLADTRPRKPAHSSSKSLGDAISSDDMKHITEPPPRKPHIKKHPSRSQSTPMAPAVLIATYETGPDYSKFLEEMQDIREISGSAENREALFIKKLKLCRMVFDFSEAEEQTYDKEKEKKRSMLLELVDYITTKPWFTKKVVDEIIQTSAKNLFRSLPYNLRFAGDIDDEDPRLDPSWPHLQLVYELLLRFVVSNDTNPKIFERSCFTRFYRTNS
eukprot:TRINITY_DN503_c0_g1_i2.p2 TRINITY_DN503_c0_g1~~TRINITY_DN503_c0_g1_i2.p2  ORF type:complete len:224 (-),score=40.63 TRINITY_DN503_c0_g1_i2:937-1608(-)